MNKKGFTLVELLLVIVIIGIIGAITIPNIMESLSASKAEGGESVEKLLEKNLELYNMDHEEDLWCDSTDIECISAESTDKNVKIEELYNMNPDIDMGECLLTTTNNSLKITIKREGNKTSYTYSAKIVCNKEFDSSVNKIATEEQIENESNYYDSTKNK